MKSIENFENKKVGNLATIIAGEYVRTNGVNGSGYWDKMRKDNVFVTRIGMFDGPRD